MSVDVWLWILIGVGGTMGGLLYGIRDKQLILPHREEKYIWNPGCLADILFGLAGGFVIFIIVPGSFDYTKGGWEAIQILALAGVGGYGGRALVEKLLSEQIHELERSVRELRRQDRIDAKTIKLLDQHLDADADTPLVPVEELQAAILSASSSAKVLIFEKARQFRKDCAAAARQRPLLAHVIPVFEALIRDDKDNKYHRNHAQLAFALKDKPNPDWKRAEEELSRAIEIRDRQHEKGFLAYDFNRAICRIQLGYDLEAIKADLERALQGEKTANWVRHPNPALVPELVNWLRANQSQLQEWIEANRIELPAEIV